MTTAPTCAIWYPIAPAERWTLPDLDTPDGIPVSRPVHRKCAKTAVKENAERRHA